LERIILTYISEPRKAKLFYNNVFIIFLKLEQNQLYPFLHIDIRPLVALIFETRYFRLGKLIDVKRASLVKTLCFEYHGDMKAVELD